VTKVNYTKVAYLVAVVRLLAGLMPIGSFEASESAEFRLPVHSEGSLSFCADACQFAGQDGKTLFEVYYSVDLAQLLGLNGASQSAAELSLNVVFVNAVGDTIVKSAHQKSVDLTALSRENNASTYVDLLRFEFTPGVVALTFKMAETVSGKNGELSANYQVGNMQGELSLSEMVLSALVSRASGSHVFEKGGLVIVPEVTRAFYGNKGHEKLFVYYEINNLSDASDSSFYRIIYNVSDLQGNPVVSGGKARIAKTGRNAARVEVLSLVEHLSDLDSQQSCVQETYFSYQSSSDAGLQLLAMAKEDVQKYYDQIKYLATDEEKKLYWQLSPQGKQEFILRFWRSRDPSPGTAENEFMLEYFKRFQYCEREIPGGLNSDMGRIYVTFGEPLERERRFSSREYDKPVEIWLYAIDGRIEFVFVDRSGDGRYVLVHSTHKDELHNPDWQRNLN
jgi:GWxTD domain-containing protein